MIIYKECPIQQHFSYWALLTIKRKTIKMGSNLVFLHKSSTKPTSRCLPIMRNNTYFFSVDLLISKSSNTIRMDFNTSSRFLYPIYTVLMLNALLSISWVISAIFIIPNSFLLNFCRLSLTQISKRSGLLYARC